MKTQGLLLAVVGTIVFALSAGAADWPQWRGPERNGISKETSLLKDWPKNGPKLVWQQKDIGGGYSTPAVADGGLYLLSNRDNEEFALLLDATNGEQIWSVKIGKVGKNVEMAPYPGARSTPTVEGDVLYCLGSDGDLVCLERAKGKERWRKNLKTDFGGSPGNWAYAESPLIDGDKLICTPGGAKATLVALNKKNGDVIWKCEVPGGDAAGYASVTITEIDGVKQYVQFLGKGVVGVEAKAGKFLWRFDRTAKGSLANIPTPIAHLGFVYSGAGQSGGGLAKVKSTEGTFKAEEVYFERDLPKAIGGVVLIGDYLYGTGAKGLMCVEYKTGMVKWSDKCIGAASICVAAGMLYLHGENGEAALVEATPDGYHEKGRFAPPDQPKHTKNMEKAWAYPVVANGRLYLRDLNMLWCYEVKAEK